MYSILQYNTPHVTYILTPPEITNGINAASTTNPIFQHDTKPRIRPTNKQPSAWICCAVA